MNTSNLALTATLLLAAPAWAQTSQLTIERTEVVPGVHQFRVDRGSSMIAIINAGDALIFDTGSRPSGAHLLLAELRRLSPVPVLYVVNSHWHPDHWSGNQVFADSFPGVTIIATAETDRYMRAVAPSWPAAYQSDAVRRLASVDTLERTGRLPDGRTATPEQLRELRGRAESFRVFTNEMAGVRRTFPTLRYNDQLTLRSGGREVVLLELDGDATGTTVLYLPRERVLFAGDLLVHPHQWGANGYAIGAWEKSLRRLAVLDIDAIVPGHGPVLRGKTYLLLVADLFAAIRERVRVALEQGRVSPEEVIEAVSLDDFRARFQAVGADFSNDLVTMAYREARDGMVTRR